ncbi:MAG: cytochrome P450 [Myxococcaceae bacterium]
MRVSPLTTAPAVPPNVFPVYRGPGLLRNLRQLKSDPLQLMRDAQQAMGPFVRCPIIGSYSLHVVTEPEALEHFLVTRRANYTKGDTWAWLRRTFGNGIVTSDGAFHQQQRARIQPGFHRKTLPRYSELVVEYARRQAERWEQLSGSVVEMQEDMYALALKVMGRLLFSVDFDVEAQDAQRALVHAADALGQLTRSLMQFLPESIPTPVGRRFQKAQDALDRAIYGLIDARVATGGGGDDLLGLLLDSGMSRLETRDEAVTLLSSGYETTGGMLAWTWYLLAQNPDVEARLHAEVDEVLQGRLPTWDDFPRLEYTGRVLMEALRLYPPAWFIARQAIEADVIMGYPIPAKGWVATALYSIHRDPRFWKDPHRFDPDRFLPGESASRPKYAYLPFGTGDRACIGKPLADLEGRLTLGVLAQRFRPRLPRPVPDVLHPLSVPLQVSGGIPMEIVPRQARQ